MREGPGDRKGQRRDSDVQKRVSGAAKESGHTSREVAKERATLASCFDANKLIKYISDQHTVRNAESREVQRRAENRAKTANATAV